jgi:hypothetical protein
MRKLFLLLLFLCVVTVGWLFRDDMRPVWAWVKSWVGSEREVEEAVAVEPEPDREAYDVLKQDLERWRKKLKERHGKARTAEARRVVERDARVVLESVLPEMMRCWLGTPWDFNGTAAGPGKDPVACGYFVSTVLQDAGFRLDRYRLAQQPSSRILTSLIPGDSCRLMVDLPYEQFVSEVSHMVPGVYVVGLDTHVAFLVVNADGFRFVHSSGSKPWRVVDEGREAADVLQKSRWRMLGNLTADEVLLRKWLAREAIPVRTS